MNLTSNGKGRSLTIGESTVEKRFSDRNEAAIELAQSLSAREVAIGTGAFIVPKVLAHTATSIVFERVHGIVPVRTEMSRDHHPEIAGRIGRALALVHSNMIVPADLRVYAPKPFDEDVVPSHGDFGLSNVQYRRHDDQIVLLDWAAANWFGSPFTHANPCLDISTFLLDLHYQRPRDPMLIRQVGVIATAFFSGYLEESSVRIVGIKSSLLRVAVRYLRGAHPGLRKWARTPSLLRLLAFAERLDLGPESTFGASNQAI